MALTLALSYGGREELLRAAGKWAERVAKGEAKGGPPSEADFESLLSTAGLPPLDLVIRTSGEHRVSNFLLWQLAYAELCVTPVLWPDFTRGHLYDALLEFQGRDRRFGKVAS